MSALQGSCHCGAIRVRLETAKTAAELPLRACQCSFCRRHGGLATSDPEGRLHISAAAGSATRYRFGLKITDFLICRHCGCYVAATSQTPEGLIGVVNPAGAKLEGFEGRTPDPMIYDDETPDERLARRAARWTPAVFVEMQQSA